MPVDTTILLIFKEVSKLFARSAPFCFGSYDIRLYLTSTAGATKNRRNCDAIYRAATFQSSAFHSLHRICCSSYFFTIFQSGKLSFTSTLCFGYLCFPSLQLIYCIHLSYYIQNDSREASWSWKAFLCPRRYYWSHHIAEKLFLDDTRRGSPEKSFAYMPPAGSSTQECSLPYASVASLLMYMCICLSALMYLCICVLACAFSYMHVYMSVAPKTYDQWEYRCLMRDLFVV